MPQFPYPVYGTVTIYGTPQVGTTVVVRNITKNEEFSKQTDANGFYLVDLADLPTDYENGDTIRVTATGRYEEFTLNTSVPSKLINIAIVMVDRSFSLDILQTAYNDIDLILHVKFLNLNDRDLLLNLQLTDIVDRDLIATIEKQVFVDRDLSASHIQ